MQKRDPACLTSSCRRESVPRRANCSRAAAVKAHRSRLRRNRHSRHRPWDSPILRLCKPDGNRLPGSRVSCSRSPRSWTGTRRRCRTGSTYSVTGWHTGALGKLVFFIGLATLILEALREAGIELPPSVPEHFVLIGLGALASIFVLVRLASIPEHVLRRRWPRDRHLRRAARLVRPRRRRAAPRRRAPRLTRRESPSPGRRARRGRSPCRRSRARRSRRPDASAASSTWPLNIEDGDRADAVALLDLAQHLPAVDVRHHHVEKDELGLARLDRGEPFRGAGRLLHGVALALELEPDELAHADVVVDEQHRRTRSAGAPGRSGR